MAVAVYNERSWAIDLIGYLKGIAHNENRAVRDVSGEQTITDMSGSLFLTFYCLVIVIQLASFKGGN